MASSNLSPRAKLIAARAMIKTRAPYFAQAVNAAVYHWVPRGTLDTMAVTRDGVVLVDEQDIERMSVEATAVSVLHEVAGHWLRDHAGRRPPGAHHHLWNIAGDAEINDDLVAMGFRELPHGLVLPATLGQKDGLTAEAYYAHLRDNAKVVQVAMKCGSGLCGSGAGHAHPNEPKTGKKGKKDQKDKEQQGAGVDGSGDDEAPGGRSDAERARVQQAVAKAIKDHEQKHGRGTVPGGWSVWADEVLQPPKVDWRAKLSALVRSAAAYRPGALVTSWHRFGRKQSGIGFGPGRPMTPSWRAPVPNVAVVVDTSGSMGRQELQDAVNETAGIIAACNGAVEFVAIDTDVHAVATISNPRDIAKHLKGGGGTDFRPAFETLCGRGRKGKTTPEVIVFITDGCGPAPQHPPQGVKTIWVLVGSYRQRPVDWGDVVDIEPEQRRAQ